MDRNCMNDSEYTERVNEIRKGLFICAQSILRNDADAEDAVSSAILRGYENLSKLRDINKFKAWMTKITKNESLKIIKKRMDLPGNEAIEAMLTPTQDSYDELWDIIQNMKDEYRKVITLFYYDDLTLKEISEVLEIPVGTVKSRLSRGKKMLKKSLGGKEELLEKFQKKDYRRHSKGRMTYLMILAIMFVAIFGGSVLFSNTEKSQASFWGHFTERIRDYFGFSKKEAEEKGIGSTTNKSVSKTDLMLEMYEQVMDDKNIYLIIKITAPPDVEFSDDVGFDYFAFCKGENYNTDKLVGGSKDCKLLQVSEKKKNIASYVVSLSSTEELKENTNMTVMFKDLKRNPADDSGEILVEGMWSLSFPVNFTVKDKVNINGTENTTYPFVNKTAKLQKIKMTPLGLTLISDISEVPADDLGVSDTSLSVRLKMMDGSEIVVASHDLEEETITTGGGNEFNMKKNKTIMSNSYEFREKISIKEVLGIYIEDLYVSFIDEDEIE